MLFSKSVPGAVSLDTKMLSRAAKQHTARREYLAETMARLDEDIERFKKHIADRKAEMQAEHDEVKKTEDALIHLMSNLNG